MKNVLLVVLHLDLRCNLIRIFVGTFLGMFVIIRVANLFLAISTVYERLSLETKPVVRGEVAWSEKVSSHPSMPS